MKKKTIDLVSIIIPIYNVEKYLEQCILSIVNQDYTNLEIILIDDGSTDNSPKICDKLAKLDNRINVIHKKNSGVSNSRNYGISIANGKYIMFVDSDDWLESKCITELLESIKKYNTKLVQGASVINDNKRKSIKKMHIEEDINELKKAILNYKYDKKYVNLRCVWGKLFVTSIIKENNLKFNEEIYLLEDGIFVYEYLKLIDNVVFIPVVTYHYRQVSTSLSHRYNSDQLLQYKKLINKLETITENDFYINYTVLECLMTFISRNVKFYKNRKKFIKELKEVLKDDMYLNCINNLDNKKLKIKEKITLILLRHKLYSILYWICFIK